MLRDTISKTMIPLIIILILIFGIWNLFLFEPAVEKEECTDVNLAAGFVYDICYDSYTKNIIILVERESEDYTLNSFNVSFFDGKEKNYNLKYDFVDGSQLYRFYAEINPGTINLALDIDEEFSKPICNESYKLFVKDCLTKSPGRVVDTFGEGEKGDYILIEDFLKKKAADFTNLESFWKLQCESDWNCLGWESCDGEIQRRTCEDLNNCAIPTDSPETVRYCGSKCIEDWDCEWSECINGFTTPSCEDLNNCNTSYILPPRVSCLFKEECTPFIQCEEWSDCDMDYTFLDLSEKDINEMGGVKSRICRDLNFCTDFIREIRSCSTGVDIYTQRFVKCDKTFIKIYNSLNDELIARIDEGTKENPYLNIYFDNQENDQYCDYCFNGKMDEDEEGIDCGGSCEECASKYGQISFSKKTWWNSFGDWVKKTLN